MFSPDVDETVLPGERPEEMVARLAQNKARVIAEMHGGAWCVGADTTVCIGGKILGKPLDANEAQQMLGMIQGTWHEVWTGGGGLL